MISQQLKEKVQDGDIVSVGNHYPSLVENGRLHELDPCNDGIYLPLKVLEQSSGWCIVGHLGSDDNLVPTWWYKK